jgi:hypothetical protein
LFLNGFAFRPLVIQLFGDLLQLAIMLTDLESLLQIIKAGLKFAKFSQLGNKLLGENVVSIHFYPSFFQQTIFFHTKVKVI